MGKKDDEAKALAAVKLAGVRDAKTFAEADRRLKVAKNLFKAAKNAGKN